MDFADAIADLVAAMGRLELAVGAPGWDNGGREHHEAEVAAAKQRVEDAFAARLSDR